MNIFEIVVLYRYLCVNVLSFVYIDETKPPKSNIFVVIVEHFYVVVYVRIIRNFQPNRERNVGIGLNFIDHSIINEEVNEI